jgi:DNA-binding winged helix-turn-helix (wHTH) protein
MSIAFGEFTLEWESRQLFRGGAPVSVSPKALELLHVLIERGPRAVSKTELHERLWPATFISDATLTSLVAELRASLGDSAGQARFVRTVHRFGYAFCATIAATAAPGGERQPVGPTCWMIWETGQVALRQGENVLGRDRDVAVWFDSVDVSRRHARISIAGCDAILEDLDSKNGTYVRGERLTAPCRLADGDRIGVGSTVVTFRVAAAGASTESRQALESDR